MKATLRLAPLLSALSLVSTNGCAPPVECGTGTRLDVETNQCVAEVSVGPDFNRVIDSLTLGDFTLTNVNVPDKLVTGAVNTYAFDIQNSTTEDEQAVSLRIALFSQSPTVVQSYFAHLKDDGVGCTDTCASAGNDRCEDGVGDAATGCRAGSDCTDCGRRNSTESDWTCEPPVGDPTLSPYDSCRGRFAERPCFLSAYYEWERRACGCTEDCVLRGNCCSDYQSYCASDGAGCQTDEYCEPNSSSCHLQDNTIAQVTLVDLPAGETKSFTYEAELPPNWTDEGDYTLAFILGEQWIVLGADGTATADPEQPALKKGEVQLHRATAAWVDTIQVPVEVDDSRTLAVTLTADTTSIVLDPTPDNARPALTANVTARALGVPVSKLTDVSFALRMPGHTFDLESYDPASPNGTYDADRRFDMEILRDDKLRPASKVTLFSACEWCQRSQAVRTGLEAGTWIGPSLEDLPKETICESSCMSAEGDENTYVIQQGPTRDLSLPLVFKRADTKLLSETLNNVGANQGLNMDNELGGTLVVTVTSEQGSGTAELPVVFRAPAAAKLADEFDPYEPAETPPAADEYAGAAGYPEKDNLTPTFARSFGGEWLGAEMQVLNQTSKDRRKQAVIKQAWRADNFMRLSVLQQTYNLLKIAGEVDFGTRREARHNKANGVFIVPTVPSAGALLSFFATGDLTNTLLEFDYDPTDEDDVAETCETEDGVETCNVLTAEVFSPTGLLDDYGVEVSSDDKSIVADDNGVFIQMVKTKEKIFPKGPIIFKVGIEGALLLGVKGALSFVRDFNAAPEFTSEIQAYLGPAVKVKGSGFGKAFLGPLGIALTGEITFAELDLLPGFTIGLTQDLRNEGQESECWWRNTGYVKIDAPITFKSMAGEVKIAAVLEVDLEVVTISVTLYEFTLFDWPALIDREWLLFSSVKRHGVGAGICAGAPVPGVTWKSPRGCKTPTGSDAYCPKADGRWNYGERFFTGPKAKGTLTLEGITEIDADFVRLRPGPGNVSWSVIRQSSAGDHTQIEHGYDESGPYVDVSGVLADRETGGPLVLAYEATLGPWEWTDKMRWIDIGMHTDNTLSASGVTVGHASATGEESVFYSDERWTHSGGSAAESYRYLDYSGAPGGPARSQGGVPGNWWGYADRPHWVGADDYDSLGWIAGPSLGGIFTPETGWFRRAFVATDSSYVVTMFCDDDCNVYVDGQLISNYNLALGWEYFTIDTLPGVPHLISVQLGNNTGGTGFALALKDTHHLTPLGCGYMPVDQTLSPGERFFSCNNSWELVHQEDGNVVLYGPNGAVWATGTSGQATTKFVQQLDGNIVLYGPNGALWASGTSGNYAAYLELGDDGSLTVNDGSAVIWTR